MTRPSLVRTAVVLALVAGMNVAAAEPTALIARIKAVGDQGAGNAEAAAAWRELVRLGPDALPDLLAALDDASPVAANWLRPAVDAVAERETAAGRPLPAAKLEAFVKDRRHAGASRRLAYELLCRADPSAPARLLPGMLDDPGAELRRDAVARALKDAQAIPKRDKAAAVAAYRKLFDAARDRDQVDLIAKELRDRGATADLATHFGFITHWLLAGPFDNTGGVGFNKAYPPERGVDPAAVYEGKKGPVRWKEHVTADPYGQVDLNTALGKNMGAVGYAFAAVRSPVERRVEVRAGSNNAVKLFLNGKQICFREEYHHGMRMDQHVGRGTLRAGRNEVLIKVCQNEQKDAWAQTWGFQLRLCDDIGGAVPFTVEVPKAEARAQAEGKQR